MIIIRPGSGIIGPGALFFLAATTTHALYQIITRRIRAVDDPVYVRPDDPRLMDVPVSPYRKKDRPKTPDDIMVIGYVHNGEVRAYPTALLDRHELVNDEIGGKPVTVGW